LRLILFTSPASIDLAFSKVLPLLLFIVSSRRVAVIAFFRRDEIVARVPVKAFGDVADFGIELPACPFATAVESGLRIVSSPGRE